VLDIELPFALIYFAVVVLALGAVLLSHVPMWSLGPIALVVLALSVRLLPALLLPLGAKYDIDSYRLVADTFLSGRDVYGDPVAGIRHPYLPFWMYWLALSRLAELSLNIPFVVLVKLPGVIADALIVFFVYRVVLDRWGEGRANQAALVYALNPISLLVVAYGGQFDSLPLLLSLIAWRLVDRQKNPILAGAALGLGILVKSWPALFLPVLLLAIPRWRERLLLLLSCGVVPLTAMCIYLSLRPGAFMAMVTNTLGYGSVYGNWGYSAGLLLAVRFLDFSYGLWFAIAAILAYLFGRWLTLAAILVAWWLALRRPLLQGMTLIILALFAFTAGFSVTYLLWLLPLVLLLDHVHRLRWYLLACLPFLIATYYFEMYQPLLVLQPLGDARTILRILSLPAWLSVLAWLGLMVGRDRNDSLMSAKTHNKPNRSFDTQPLSPLGKDISNG